jgi:hypothetical protein
MRTLIAILITGAVVLPAQQLVAPSPESVGIARGEDWHGYNIINSFEIGYRERTVSGNVDKYRSDVNLGNGIGLMAGRLTAHSKTGQGGWFDELVLTTQGMNSDPYRFASARLQKNGLYRYDFTFRENDYFNPGLTTNGGAGSHYLNTEYLLQDHDVTLFPQSAIKFLAGYSRGIQTGPGLSTVQLFDAHGSEFPLLENVRRVRNEYRIGNEVEALGWKLNWMRGWEDFREETLYGSGAGAGNDANPNTRTSSVSRREPYHGASPYWRAGIFTGRTRFNLNGRFTYTSGRRAFVLDEREAGAGTFGAAIQRYIVALGDARRPVMTGDLSLHGILTPKLTISNRTAVYRTRIQGTSTYGEYINGGLNAVLLGFQYLDLRTIANETTLNYQFARRMGIGLGYQFSRRQVSSAERSDAGFFTSDQRAVQTNRLHSGSGELRLQPLPRLSVLMDGEIGRADHPIYPISDANYRTAGGRVQFRTKKLTLSASSRANYNNNPASLSVYSSRSRNYGARASWRARNWLSFEADYSRVLLNTVGGLAYFARYQLVQGDRSYYFSNLHTANAGAHLSFAKRADIYLGFARVQDTGDGRRNALGNGIGSPLPAFQIAQTFPLTYQTPLVRISIPIRRWLRWNIGYQFYGYREEFFVFQSYHAHTGYSSLLWSF